MSNTTEIHRIQKSKSFSKRNGNRKLLKIHAFIRSRNFAYTRFIGPASTRAQTRTAWTVTDENSRTDLSGEPWWAWKSSEGKLRLNVGLSSYKDFNGTNLNDNVFKITDDRSFISDIIGWVKNHDFFFQNLFSNYFFKVFFKNFQKFYSWYFERSLSTCLNHGFSKSSFLCSEVILALGACSFKWIIA